MSKSKYSYEQKIKCVFNVLKKGMSLRTAGSFAGISKASVQQWIKTYQEHGEEGLLKKKRSYDGKLVKSLQIFLNVILVRQNPIQSGLRMLQNFHY